LIPGIWLLIIPRICKPLCSAVQKHAEALPCVDTVLDPDVLRFFILWVCCADCPSASAGFSRVLKREGIERENLTALSVGGAQSLTVTDTRRMAESNEPGCGLILF
jgi:hypothetical protein